MSYTHSLFGNPAKVSVLIRKSLKGLHETSSSPRLILTCALMGFFPMSQRRPRHFSTYIHMYTVYIAPLATSGNKCEMLKWNAKKKHGKFLKTCSSKTIEHLSLIYFYQSLYKPKPKNVLYLLYTVWVWPRQITRFFIKLLIKYWNWKVIQMLVLERRQIPKKPSAIKLISKCGETIIYFLKRNHDVCLLRCSIYPSKALREFKSI